MTAPRVLVKIGVIAILPVFILSCGPKGPQIKVDLYVESMNPYGAKTEEVLFPLLEKFGDRIDFNLDFIALDNGSGNITSVRGDAEKKGDIIQLCVKKHYPERYRDFILSMNENLPAIPDNWKDAAEKHGLDTDEIEVCFEGGEGAALLRESVGRAYAAEAQITPTLYINGELYADDRTSDRLLKALCRGFRGEWPPACSALPEPKWVNVIFLTDKRCGDECTMDKVVDGVKRDFPGIIITEVDYNTEEGKKLFKESGVDLLPAVLFDESVKNGEGYEKIKKFLEPAGKYLSLHIRATFDPLSEICDNGIDDNNNGKVDCDDPGCEDSAKCRPERPGNLTVFILSDEMYSKKAIGVMQRIMALGGSSFTYNVRYMVGVDEQGNLVSNNGPKEIEENEVQLLVQKYYPDRWFDYVACRSLQQVIETDRKACALSTGVDLKVIYEALKSGEGERLLVEDETLAVQLGLRSVPTWLINNRYIFAGLDYNEIVTRFCRYNPDVKFCHGWTEEEIARKKANKARDFSLYDLEGKVHSPDEFVGKKTLILFWSSHCEACHTELPEMEALSRDREDVNIILVNLGEDEAVVRQFVQDFALTLPVFLDSGKIVGNLYNVVYTPAAFYLNSDGTVYFKYEGAMTRGEIEEVLNKMK